MKLSINEWIPFSGRPLVSAAIQFAAPLIYADTASSHHIARLIIFSTMGSSNNNGAPQLLSVKY